MIATALRVIRQAVFPTVPDRSGEALARWAALDGRTPDRPGAVIVEEGEAPARTVPGPPPHKCPCGPLRECRCGA